MGSPAVRGCAALHRLRGAARPAPARSGSRGDARAPLARRAAGRPGDHPGRCRPGRASVAVRDDRDRPQRDLEHGTDVGPGLGGVLRECQPGGRRAPSACWVRSDGFRHPRRLPACDRGTRAGRRPLGARRGPRGRRPGGRKRPPRRPPGRSRLLSRWPRSQSPGAGAGLSRPVHQTAASHLRRVGDAPLPGSHRRPYRRHPLAAPSRGRGIRSRAGDCARARARGGVPGLGSRYRIAESLRDRRADAGCSAAPRASRRRADTAANHGGRTDPVDPAG